MTKKLLFRCNDCREKVILPPTFHIEADGRGKTASVLISGVLGVKSFSEKEMLVTTKLIGISIRGSILKIEALELKRIRVFGMIDEIAFSERKRGRKVES